ncbi:MAG: S-methylmethionine-dependent homocysteine/selenocysteine methylase [Planctomycetota bacterium]|jgi:S-methylmethionine-dependent homocysteine/selenocysteine methylase
MSYEYIKNKLDNKELVFLDGGTGTEIERQGVTMNDLAWCGIAHMEHPDVVRKVHESYIEAGADIIIANTFSTAPHLALRLGLEDKIVEINSEAVKIAQRARDCNNRNVCVAASMSSLPALDSRHIPSGDEISEGYAEQAKILAEAGAELIVTEMMMDIENATIVVQAANSVGLPVWTGFSVSINDKDELTNYDDIQGFEYERMSFEKMATSVLPLGCDVAGIMHSRVDHVESALAELAKLWKGPMMAYAESGHFVPPSWKFEDTISIAEYFEYALKWMDAGAQVIGGCCGIGPEHIKVLKDNLPPRISN